MVYWILFVVFFYFLFFYDKYDTLEHFGTVVRNILITPPSSSMAAFPDMGDKYLKVQGPMLFRSVSLKILRHHVTSKHSFTELEPCFLPA